MREAAKGLKNERGAYVTENSEGGNSFQSLAVQTANGEWQCERVSVLNEYLILLVGRSVADIFWGALKHAKHHFTTLPKKMSAVLLHSRRIHTHKKILFSSG